MLLADRGCDVDWIRELEAMQSRRDPIEKLAADYLAFVKLASIGIWLCVVSRALGRRMDLASTA